MGRVRRRTAALLTVGCLAIGGGCGGGKPPAESSTEEATVKGKVSFLGKPATGGQLVFDPTNINRPDSPIRTAPIGGDGTYLVSTLAGPNSISVSSPKSDRKLKGMSTELNLNVQPGANTLDVSLPLKDQ